MIPGRTGWTKEQGNPGNAAAIAAAPRCTAVGRTSKKPCGNPAMANGKCRLHGGKTPGGLASPNYKHGKTSKYFNVPIPLVQAFMDAKDDPELLNLSEDAALLSARVNQLLTRLASGEAKERWRMVKETWKQFRTAQKAQDQLTMAEAVKNMDYLLGNDPHDYLVWDDIMKTMKEYRATASQEQKRRMEMSALISVDEAMAFVGQILHIVKENVSDPKELMAIRQEAQMAMTMRPGMARAMAIARGEQDNDG